MAVSLDQIVPWGRLRTEYELMFNLTPEDLTRDILDCGGGPASFNAEATAAGCRVVSVDPIYAYSGEEIRARFESTLETVLSQVRTTPEDWTWSYHRDPDDLRANRITAMERFLGDYGAGLQEDRYVVGDLPTLPFDSSSFGLALCSHLLFLYSDLLGEEFHVRSVFELCRIASEVRIFPLLSLRREFSPHVAAVRRGLTAAGWQSEVVRVGYELQRGANQMLRVYRPSPAA